MFVVQRVAAATIPSRVDWPEDHSLRSPRLAVHSESPRKLATKKQFCARLEPSAVDSIASWTLNLMSSINFELPNNQLCASGIAGMQARAWWAEWPVSALYNSSAGSDRRNKPHHRDARPPSAPRPDFGLVPPLQPAQAARMTANPYIFF